MAKKYKKKEFSMPDDLKKYHSFGAVRGRIIDRNNPEKVFFVNDAVETETAFVVVLNGKKKKFSKEKFELRYPLV